MFVVSNSRVIHMIIQNHERFLLYFPYFSTNMWRCSGESDVILFNCVVKETGKKCLAGGWAKVEKTGMN